MQQASLHSKTNQHQAPLSFVEFVALMAAMTSLAALATDAMLPALSIIGTELGAPSENANQLVVSLLFFGLAAGQLLYGPLSDTTGRKPAIYAGYVVFIVGCILSIFAGSFGVMLAGRLLQGIGIAGPRSVSVALVRDQYEGRAMAQVMSFVMAVFILVPVIAPAIGQAILLVADWRAIFGAFLVLALLTVSWFGLRQPETLASEQRKPWSLRRIAGAFGEVLHNRTALGYTVAAGLVSGAFLGYLNSAQQIFQIQYGLGSRFALVFAILALALGTASFLNARLVMRYGMRKLSHGAALLMSVFGTLFLLLAASMGGQPPLLLLMAYLMATFFCVGILFGNQNSLAMEPLGHIAGVGAAVVGSLSLFMATPLGMVVGQSYNGTVLPLVMGFAILGGLALGIMLWVERGTKIVDSEE
jgi:DHA1 family bicyclomycin/chloramphenicol resistance-like MFS transporter